MQTPSKGYKFPNFTRYLFFVDGNIKNVATDKSVEGVALADGGFVFRLTTDTGQRVSITKEKIIHQWQEMKEFEQKYVTDEGLRLIGQKSKTNTSPKFNYELAQAIRTRIANGEKPGVIAREFGVDTWAIHFIILNLSYKIRPGDTNPITPALYEELISKNIPHIWKGKTREEIRSLVGYSL